MRFAKPTLLSVSLSLIGSILVPAISSVNHNSKDICPTRTHLADGMPLPPPHDHTTLLADGMPLPPPHGGSALGNA